MPAEKYKQCCDAQKKHREAIEHIEGLLGPINVRIHDIAEIQFQERSADKKRIEELERENAALREKFMFAESEIILLREERDELRADKERV